MPLVFFIVIDMLWILFFCTICRIILLSAMTISKKLYWVCRKHDHIRPPLPSHGEPRHSHPCNYLPLLQRTTLAGLHSVFVRKYHTTQLVWCKSMLRRVLCKSVRVRYFNASRIDITRGLLARSPLLHECDLLDLVEGLGHTQWLRNTFWIANEFVFIIQNHVTMRGMHPCIRRSAS